ncbi:hypothetical protein [Anaeromyxobacter dehalogenans]|uniref:hypothetical protein n=1 Tax=Anaeromyxobacter dehalogenans TaxID=161493 RepID=UPI001FE2358E|nr:hypothetical protein [Anaeromyxobacter dehalogenans]
MKHACAVVAVACTLVHCSGGSIEPAEVRGEWASNDGGRMVFTETGFTAEHIPAPVLGLLGSPEPKLVGGKGRWGVRKREIWLVFDALAEHRSGFRTDLLTEGRGGAMILFNWKGEEGGERYELHRVDARHGTKASPP